MTDGTILKIYIQPR